jgi:hypothetical protein
MVGIMRLSWFFVGKLMMAMFRVYRQVLRVYFGVCDDKDKIKHQHTPNYESTAATAPTPTNVLSNRCHCYCCNTA